MKSKKLGPYHGGVRSARAGPLRSLHRILQKSHGGSELRRHSKYRPVPSVCIDDTLVSFHRLCHKKSVELAKSDISHAQLSARRYENIKNWHIDDTHTSNVDLNESCWPQGTARNTSDREEGNSLRHS